MNKLVREQMRRELVTILKRLSQSELESDEPGDKSDGWSDD